MNPQTLPRCRHCRARIIWLTKAMGAEKVCVEVRPVDPHGHLAVGALVRAGETAYEPRDLAEVLMQRRGIALEDAFDTARNDFMWHARHLCLTDERGEVHAAT